LPVCQSANKQNFVAKVPLKFRQVTISNLSNSSRVTNQAASNDCLTELCIQATAPFNATNYCYNTGKFHTWNIWDSYLPKHPDICFLSVPDSLIENEPNKVCVV